RREVNVRFRRVHLRRVAEAEYAAEVLLSDRGADLPDRRADHGRRFPGEGVLPVGPASPVDRILERTWDGAIVLRCDEEYRVHSGDGILEVTGNLGIVGVVIVAVER